MSGPKRLITGRNPGVDLLKMKKSRTDRLEYPWVNLLTRSLQPQVGYRMEKIPLAWMVQWDHIFARCIKRNAVSIYMSPLERVGFKYGIPLVTLFRIVHGIPIPDRELNMCDGVEADFSPYNVFVDPTAVSEDEDSYSRHNYYADSVLWSDPGRPKPWECAFAWIDAIKSFARVQATGIWLDRWSGKGKGGDRYGDHNLMVNLPIEIRSSLNGSNEPPSRKWLEESIALLSIRDWAWTETRDEMDASIREMVCHAIMIGTNAINNPKAVFYEYRDDPDSISVTNKSFASNGNDGIVSNQN